MIVLPGTNPGGRWRTKLEITAICSLLHFPKSSIIETFLLFHLQNLIPFISLIFYSSAQLHSSFLASIYVFINSFLVSRLPTTPSIVLTLSPSLVTFPRISFIVQSRSHFIKIFFLIHPFLEYHCLSVTQPQSITFRFHFTLIPLKPSPRCLFFTLICTHLFSPEFVLRSFNS